MNQPNSISYEILEHVPLYITKLDLDLKITWGNKQALDSGDILSHKCYKDFNPDLEQCTFCPIVRAMSSLKTEISLIEISSEDDKIFEVTAIPTLNEYGELDGIFEIRKDISSQIQHPIKTEKVTKKNKEHIFSSDQLIEIVTNELREHTTNAVKMHGRIDTRKLNQDQKISIAGVRTSLMKVENVLGNINVIRNINKGILKQANKKGDLKELIIDTVSHYQNKTDFNGNSFDYKFDSSIPSKLIFDHRKTQLILSNLIDYSMSHTLNRYIHLTATLQEDIDDGIKISYKIKNIGSIGIHDLVKRDAEGYIKNNLTLTVIHHLVKSQNGELKLSPINGYGIDAELILSYKKPFTMNKLPLFNRLLSSQMSKKEMMDENKRKKILIAEDEPIGRITIEQMLKQDYEIILAKNGKVAVEKYFEEEPDLVIMDIMMPIMNGFDAFDQIERNCIKRVPIIAYTAKVIKSEKEYLKSYGFDDYLAKPVGVKVLREMVKKHIT